MQLNFQSSEKNTNAQHGWSIGILLGYGKATNTANYISQPVQNRIALMVDIIARTLSSAAIKTCDHINLVLVNIAFIHDLVLGICICYLLSTLSRISITGCLGSPMMTPVGSALTMSALKNSEFSGMPSSTMVTLKSSLLVPG